MRFESEEARRAYFLERLGEKLRDPAFRAIEGFPLGKEEDILALSDPPYYTACPNPFLEEFIRHYGRPYDPGEEFRREPFAADVSEGKGNRIYNAHAYHTKVPHRAIMRYLLHYTEPGDIVLDGFCGTGMTGVAAQLCADREAVEELGYTVREDGSIVDADGETISRLGERKAILNDLSPAAAFIAHNYNRPAAADRFEREAQCLLRSVEESCGWMYRTLHFPTQAQIEDAIAQSASRDAPFGQISYSVWSDVFYCSVCGGEVVFSEVATDTEGHVRNGFECPRCRATLTKRTMERAWETAVDPVIDDSVRQPKRVPILIRYTLGNQAFEKRPDGFDLALLRRIESSPLPHRFPHQALPRGIKVQEPARLGITHVHHFYSRRALLTLAAAYAAAREAPDELRRYVLFTVQQAVLGMAKIARYVPRHYSQVNQYLNGTLYVASQTVDVSLRYVLDAKIERLARMLRSCSYRGEGVIAATATSTVHSLPAQSVDYIFLDPPFGSNLMYSELNFLWEAWLGILTNSEPEAIENGAQGKRLEDYQHLLTRCFQAFHRALKPGRWMTVVFHNSRKGVWCAVQQSLLAAGLVIADVRILDKQQGTFNQIGASGSVKQDLVISAYRPATPGETRSVPATGTVDGGWEFVRQRLAQLPVHGEAGESRIERTKCLLFDRMVAFHLERGLTVPLSASQFYAGLDRQFIAHDGMYFLPGQFGADEQERGSVR